MTLKRFLKLSEYALQAIPFFLFVGLVRILPHGLGAWICGWVAWWVGRLTRGQKIALRNLKIVYPDLSLSEQQLLTCKIWRHLGAVFVDSCFIPRMAQNLDQYITLRGGELITHAKTQNRPVMLVSAHFGNWEMLTFISNLTNIRPHYIYRQINNVFMDRWLGIRRGFSHGIFDPKNNDTARKFVRSYHLKQDTGLLTDQKLNGGVDVPFFNRPCKTALTPFVLALKHDYEIVLCHSLRIDRGLWKPPHFEIRIEKPTCLETNLISNDAMPLLKNIHHHFETWILENPQQWFWIHDRWGNSES